MGRGTSNQGLYIDGINIQNLKCVIIKKKFKIIVFRY